MRTASSSFDFETSPLCWNMTNPQFPSRRFMIMKWSCLTGYQNFMESRPPSFSPRSLISVQVQHQRTGAAMTPQSVWVLLTDTWLCLLVWKTGVTTYYLCKSFNAEGEGCMAIITQELLGFSTKCLFVPLRDKSDFPHTAASEIRHNLNL